MKSFALALGLASVAAMCPNSCSGHGSCGNDDLCHCYTDWLSGDESGGDCSERKCPFELAWFDTPSAAGTAHAYAECAGRGVCDRSTGECQCFDGFTGKGCRRTTCPNDCSGHGTCEYLSEFRDDLGDWFKLSGDAPTTDKYEHSYYKLWDAQKTMGCRCDPKWTDLDCSRRMCPKGSYALYDDSVPTYEVQTVTIAGQKNGVADEFALTFRTTLNEEFTTKKLSASPLLNNKMVEDALNELPNKVIEDVDVVITAGANVNAKATYEWHFTHCGDYGTTTSITPSIGSGNAVLIGAPTCDSNGILFNQVDEYATLGTVAIPLYAATSGGKASIMITGHFPGASGDGEALLNIGGVAKLDIAAGKAVATFDGCTFTSDAEIGVKKSIIVTYAGHATAASTVMAMYTNGAVETSTLATGSHAASTTATFTATNWVGKTTTAATSASTVAGAADRTIVTSVRLFPGVVITAAEAAILGAATPADIKIDVHFLGAATTGDQFQLECRSKQCDAGCQPKLGHAVEYMNASDVSAAETASCTVVEKHVAKSANLECSGRGRCDYGSGTCECFTGYTDEFCGTQSALI